MRISRLLQNSGQFAVVTVFLRNLAFFEKKMKLPIIFALLSHSIPLCSSNDPTLLLLLLQISKKTEDSFFKLKERRVPAHRDAVISNSAFVLN